jgi:hypothetical protein
MVWQKLGLVLGAPVPVDWAASHAALPTVEEVDDDGVALLFSARDDRGRSHIGRARVELMGGAPRAFAEPGEPLLAPGALGAFDDSGVTTSCVVHHGGRRYLFYTGWTLGVTVPFYLFAGCAVSEDGGATYERVGAGPLLDRNGADPFLTASPWVLVEGELWRMWYVSATGWRATPSGPQHRYRVCYAESRDGTSWTRDGTVCIDFRDDAEYAISRPCVVKDADRYRMWFSARGPAYRIGYAESSDGISWTRLDDHAGFEPSTEGWDAEMQAYPVVFDHGDRRYLLYNGNGYGRTGIGLARA